MSSLICAPIEADESPLSSHRKDVKKLSRQLTKGIIAHLTTPKAEEDGAARLRTESGASPRIAILLSGTRGDHQPAIPLSLALKEQGLDVRIFAKRTFEAMFAKFGIQMTGLPGVDYEEIFTDESVRSGLASGQPMITNLAINHILETTYDETGCLDAIVQGLTEFKPALIIWHMTLVVEAIVSSQICKCPSVCLAMFPYAPTSNIACFALAPRMSSNSWMNFGKFGVKQSHAMLWKNFYLLGKGKMKQHVWETYRIALSGNKLYKRYGDPEFPMICAWSPSLGPRPDDYHAGVLGPVGFLRLSGAVQTANFTLPAGLEEFLKRCSRDQLAYISWGSMGSGSDEGLTKLAVGALMLSKAKGVIQGGYSDLQLDKLKDPAFREYASENIFFIPKGVSIPHNWLFPQCGVCVHHGGIGTLAACLYAGTPSVITPVFVDQFYWAQRTQENGTGLYGPYLARAGKKKLGACIKKCLEDLKGEGKMAAAATLLGERMQAEDGVGEAAKIVIELISKGWHAPN